MYASTLSTPIALLYSIHSIVRALLRSPWAILAQIAKLKCEVDFIGKSGFTNAVAFNEQSFAVVSETPTIKFDVCELGFKHSI